MTFRPKPFLTAEWRHLVMLSYEVDPAVLAGFVPRGTELDQWQGKTFVSMIGFRFLNTRVLGFAVPFHTDFDEVNLRFYVKRLTAGGWRRAAVFIKEIVARHAIAWTARLFYNENYVVLPTSHEIQAGGGNSIHKASYKWTFRGRLNRLALVTEGEAAPIVEGSQEEFITEHYWGYARQRDGGTVEYEVEHPRWRVCAAQSATLDCDAEALYGSAFARYLEAPPASAFLADGSAVSIAHGRRVA